MASKADSKMDEAFGNIMSGSLKLKGIGSLGKVKKKKKTNKAKEQKERILKKAEKSHKERVEELNGKLDTLSEHYDIPKVSWTK
uniref:Protein FAM32A n=1 Tax=Amphimedon queenslandica TaxID=400682 RepID=A0A1X7V8T3_AMPQE